MTYKEIIVHLVGCNHGIMRNDLSLKVMEHVNPQKFNAEQYMTALDELVITGEILELPFTTPETIGNTVKMRSNDVYFPRGTRICVPLFLSNNDSFSRI